MGITKPTNYYPWLCQTLKSEGVQNSWIVLHLTGSDFKTSDMVPKTQVQH